MKIYNNFNVHHMPEKGEYNDGIHMTVPNEAMSISEMLERHVRGLPINTRVNMEYEYEGDENVDFEDLNPLSGFKKDPVEVQEVIEEATQRLVDTAKVKKKKKDEKVSSEKSEEMNEERSEQKSSDDGSENPSDEK